MLTRILLVASDVFVRRLTPSLSEFVRLRVDFRILDIARPWRDLRREINALAPQGIITEALPDRTKRITALGIPTVIADCDTIFPGVVSIDVDDDAVGRAAAEFFLNSGHRHFACVRNQTAYSDQRHDGFAARVRAAGYPVRSFFQKAKSRPYMESWNEDSQALADWLRALPKPTAVFAVHDPLGRLVCDAAADAGVAVPEDLSVVAANDDALVCGLSYPPLSSVQIPWDRVGELAAEWMLRLVKGGTAPKRAILVPPGPVRARQSASLSAVDDPELRRVVQYFRDHFREPISVGTTCGSLRVSRRQVERKFATLLHASPWAVLSRMRVDAAKDELISSDRPLAEIAANCGFSDPAQFSRVFRRVTGDTPSRLRGRAGCLRYAVAGSGSVSWIGSSNSGSDSSAM